MSDRSITTLVDAILDKAEEIDASWDDLFQAAFRAQCIALAKADDDRREHALERLEEYSRDWIERFGKSEQTRVH